MKFLFVHAVLLREATSFMPADTPAKAARVAPVHVTALKILTSRVQQTAQPTALHVMRTASYKLVVF